MTALRFLSLCSGGCALAALGDAIVPAIAAQIGAAINACEAWEDVAA